MASAYKWTHHQRRRIASAGDVKVWLTEETTRGTYKSPVAGDVLQVNESIGIAQLAERIASEGLETGNRDPAETFLGRFDHFEVPLAVHPRPPLALAGTSEPQEKTLWKALCGSQKHINSQAEEDIDSVTSHARSGTVFRISDSLAAWSTRPVILRYISHADNADTVDNNGLYEVTAATEPSSGVVELTIEPGLPHHPIVSPSKDSIQGVSVYYFDDDIRWEDTGVSLLVKRGYQVFAASGGVVNQCAISRDARNLLTAAFTYHGERVAWRAAEDQISGNGTIDGINSTELSMEVGNAAKQTDAALLTIRHLRFNIATGVYDDVGTEGATTPLKVASFVEATNVITFEARGDNAIGDAAGTNPEDAGNLRVETGPSQEKDDTSGYDVSTNVNLKMSISDREFITIDVTSPTAPASPSAATAAEIAANINYWFKTSKYYGQFQGGRGGQAIDWETVASAIDTGADYAVHIVDPCFGSESRIQLEAAGSLDASAVIFDAVFDIRADDELQLVPWTPGGTVTLKPIHSKFGMPMIEGHYMKGSEFTLDLSQEVAWIEDVVNLDGYPDGVVSGLRRTLTAGFNTPAYGWTDDLDYLAEQDTESYVRYQVGKLLGGSYGFFMGATKVGVPEPGGDNAATKQVELSPSTPTGSRALIVAVG